MRRGWNFSHFIRRLKIPFLPDGARHTPAVLFCRGELSLLASPMLGVIGTRKANQFGETVAGQVGRHFSYKNVCLCNGLADGIDICSVTHDGSFLPGVIGVMACGLDILECNLTSKRITERAGNLLAAKGLLVSEFPLALPRTRIP